MPKPEHTYITSVLPLGFLFVFGGVMMLQVFMIFPYEVWDRFPFPFIKSVLEKKILLFIIDLLYIFIGVGLLKRWRLAWFTFFTFMTLGTVWFVLGAIFDCFPGMSYKYLKVLLAIFTNAGISVGIYIATKSVFINHEE